MNLPFYLKGAYAYKVDPKKDLINYKPTKLDKIFRIATDRNNYEIYMRISFMEVIDNDRDDLDDYRDFVINFIMTEGELFDIVDKTESKLYLEYYRPDDKNLYWISRIDENRFEFSEEKFYYKAKMIDKHILHLTAFNLETEEVRSYIFRFVAKIHN